MASKEKRQQRARQKRKQQNVARNRCSRLAVDHVVTFTGNDLGAIMEALPPPDYAGYDLLEPVIRVAVAKRETGGDGMPDEEMLFADVIFFMAIHEYWFENRNEPMPVWLLDEACEQLATCQVFRAAFRYKLDQLILNGEFSLPGNDARRA